MAINYNKLDNYVWNSMFRIGAGGAVSVIDLFHYVKDKPEFYIVMGRNIKNLEDRRKIMNYDYTVPILKNSIGRLQRKNMMSQARRMR